MDYQKEAIKTLSHDFFPHRVNAHDLVAEWGEVRKTIYAAAELDAIKRLLFYAKPKRQEHYAPDAGPLKALTERQQHILHAAIGLATEAGELLEAVWNHVYHGQPLDEINVREEAGDIEWYGAVLREAMGWTQAEVQEANVRKLRLRNGGDSFNAEANAERDTDAERAAIEHYADTNTTYVPVRAGTSADAHEVAPGVVVDYDAEGQVLGVTIERGTAIAAPNKA